MAKIILKSRYLKKGSLSHSENLIKYIAKRDGVQKIDDTWKESPATKEQQKLIAEIIKDFPDANDSLEYEDYMSSPSKGTASEFITRAIEENTDLIGKRENYVEYIAKRPRAERQGSHGLFTDKNIPINLSKVAKEVANHDGNVWTNIISLRREDAARLGYDNAYAWRNLMRSQSATIAKNMKIPLGDLRWYAAYHDEGHHPHVHMVAYSVGKEPYLSKIGIQNIKSAFARQIFKQDLLQVYAEQTKQRDTLTQKSQALLSDIIKQIDSGDYDNPVIAELLTKLSKTLKIHKGKKVYGYLSQSGRNIVNAIVDELAKEKSIAALYDLWYEQRNIVIQTYQNASAQRIPMSQNKEFKVIKNTVIKEALNILYDSVTFEEPVSGPEEMIIPDQPDYEEEQNHSSKSDKKSNLYYRKAKKYLNKNNPMYNPAEAVKWLEMSASHGYEWAQYRLGKLYLLGEEVEQNVPYALERLWEAESQENVCAQYLLGKTYLNGQLVEQNFSQAEMLLEKASEQDSIYAMYSLAKMHLAGLAQQSSEQRAIQLLNESAEKGNQWSQYLLGKFYFRGEHTEKDMQKAECLLTMSAEQKNSQAQYLLAKLYLCGDGISQDVEKAVYWLWESVKQNNQYAQYQLGKMLLFGQAVLKDTDTGLKLLTAAAEQGNVFAARILQFYMSNSNQKPSVNMAPLRLLMQLARMFQERIRSDENDRQELVDAKLFRKIAEKKQAHGLRIG